jgi:TolB-like protein/two-component SAPR family response regulator/cytochrome c-type biogenesis protein CcmH/NrfG
MSNVKKAQNRHLQASESGAGLRIFLLGPVMVEIDGKPVTIASKKARALLGYLVQRGGTEVARSTITGLLWGERGEEQARASLRQTLSELRAALAGPDQQSISANNESITWAAESAWTDSKEFESAVRSDDDGALLKAAPLMRGEFMEGLSVDESAFDHWLAGERERLRLLACTVYSRLMDRAERSGDIEEALSYGLKLISLDPLQEGVHRSLMRLYAAQGRNDAALAQYERCKRELSSQLGVQPEPETETLARSIKTGRHTAPAKMQVQAPPPPALPDKPSIAVLPFTNLTNNREQDFFADGMTEDIIGALSRMRDLFVISRMSSFVYKGRTISAENTARELGVRYILEGSVRVAGDRVRVNAHLIDGLSGGPVWAERYEGDINDIFKVQDEITRSISLALQVKLTEGESARLWEGQTNNLRAWEKMVQAREVFSRYSTIDTAAARKLLEEVLIIDPEYAGAIALLGTTYYWDARFSPSVDKMLSLNLAEAQAEKILALNPEIAAAYTLRGMVAYLHDQHDEGIEFSKRAVDLAPSDFRAVTYLGQAYIYSGEPEKAAITLKTAARLKPYRESWVTYYITLSHLWMGNLAAALESAELYLQQEPDEPYGFMYLSVVYGFLEQHGKTKETVAQLKERFPAFGIKNVLLSEHYKDREKLDRIVNILRTAGLPE